MCVCVFGCVWLVVPGVRKPIQNGLNRVSDWVLGPKFVVPEVRKPHSEWTQPGIGGIFGRAWGQKTHSEWAQPGIGATFGNA